MVVLEVSVMVSIDVDSTTEVTSDVVVVTYVEFKVKVCVTKPVTGWTSVEVTTTGEGVDEAVTVWTVGEIWSRLLQKSSASLLMLKREMIQSTA